MGYVNFVIGKTNGFCIGNYKVRFGNEYEKYWNEACQNRAKKALETHFKNKEGSEQLESISKVSIEFFKKLYEKLDNKDNIYTEFLNHEYIVFLTKHDLKILKENNISKHIFYLDFWQDNKVIEFNGTYWHRNLKNVDEIRKRILEDNHGMKVLFIDECEYYQNEEREIEKCINFLKGDQ